MPVDCGFAVEPRILRGRRDAGAAKILNAARWAADLAQWMVCRYQIRQVFRLASARFDLRVEGRARRKGSKAVRRKRRWFSVFHGFLFFGGGREGREGRERRVGWSGCNAVRLKRRAV